MSAGLVLLTLRFVMPYYANSNWISRSHERIGIAVTEGAAPLMMAIELLQSRYNEMAFR
jgi:hypothetical protein